MSTYVLATGRQIPQLSTWTLGNYKALQTRGVTTPAPQLPWRLHTPVRRYCPKESIRHFVEALQGPQCLPIVGPIFLIERKYHMPKIYIKTLFVIVILGLFAKRFNGTVFLIGIWDHDIVNYSGLYITLGFKTLRKGRARVEGLGRT